MGASANRGQMHILSTQRMPFAPRTEASAERTWQGSDSEERYRKRPHPTLGPNDVHYRFNAHGYRCRDFDSAGAEGAVSVVSLGASEVVGTGVPQDQTFSAVFARTLGERLGRPAMDWNLGAGGCGADYIARMLVSVLPVLRPDVVLLCFPHQARREHIHADGRISFHNRDGAGARKVAERILDPEKFVLNRASMDLSSEYNDAVNLYKNYQVCEALCEKHRAMWLFCATRESFLEQITHLVDAAHWVRPGIGDLKDAYTGGPETGLARDMQHPGIGPHREMASLLLDRLQTHYADRLRLLERTAVTG